MEFLKKKFNGMIRSSLISSMFLIIIGFLLIMKPEEVLSLISIVIGIGIVIIGIFGVINYIRDLQEGTTMSLEIIYGVICLIVGSILITNTKIVGSILPIVMGIWMIMNSIIKAQYTLMLKDDNNARWKVTLVFSILTLICGILFIFNPFKGAAILTQIIGSILVIYAVIDIANVMVLKKNIKDFKKDVKQDMKKVKERIEDISEEVTEATYEEMPKKKKNTKKTKKD